jgi:hypothetical protein
MTRFVVGDDRSQSTLFPERLEDYLSEDNPVRAIDVFVDELDLAGLGFGGVEPEATGRPAYHPATLDIGLADHADPTCRRHLGKSRFAPVRNVTRWGTG